MDKLEEIQVVCKYGAILIINYHTSALLTAKDALEEVRINHALCTQIYCTVEAEKRIVEKDELVVIKLHVNSHMPNYIVCHYNVTSAIEQAYKLLKEKGHIK